MSEYMPFFDARLYRALLYDTDAGGKSTQDNLFYPHFDYGSYVTDFYESTEAIQSDIDELKEGEQTDTVKAQIDALNERKDFVKDFNKSNYKEYLAPRSFIHPYAVVKLAGASGIEDKLTDKMLTFDSKDHRKWYEINGNDAGHYANNPTTTRIISWGSEDVKGRTPYSFQDFIFCKHWNKIPNNRMITLRRYAAPVTDAITFSDYPEINDKKFNEGSYTPTNQQWAPVATAVTYFGDDTGNTLSDLLSFSAGYNWEEITAAEHPIDISSSQSEMGTDLVKGVPGISSGMMAISKMLGFYDTYKADGSGNGIDPALSAANLPPDPYKDGPYENRIMGPINVIMNTYKRKRGLTYKHSITLKFNYIARPIAGINNKAVLLDLMSNMLVLCYASGTWFGGMWRYKTDKPAIYPFKYGDAMNKLYRGQLIGKDGAIRTTLKHAYNDGKGMFSEVFKEMLESVKSLFSDAVSALVAAVEGDKGKAKDNFKGIADSVNGSQTVKTIEKILSAKALAGANIPYIHNQKALLTGEPVGDWHLTIGNPLNPIAMIGNLIVKDCKIEFMNELGPDDFPIGFTAIVTLEHGLGRDRDAIESMFNRGYGRIYSLPQEFKTTADGETKVDANSGMNGKVRQKYEETRNTFFGRGFRFIAKTETSALKNSGVTFGYDTFEYDSLSTDILRGGKNVKVGSPIYHVSKWQANWTL